MMLIVVIIMAGNTSLKFILKNYILIIKLDFRLKAESYLKQRDGLRKGQHEAFLGFLFFLGEND